MMRKITDLFCLTFLFAKFNMLGSFILHFLANIEEYTPNMIFQMEPEHSVSPIKYGSKLGINCFGQIYLGTVLHGGLIIRSYHGKGRGVSQMHFPAI